MLLALLAGAALLAPCAPAPQSDDDAPRLVVFVSVDQLIPEQLERLAPWLDGGLGRMLEHGRVYRRALLQHASTETGPGHAVFATGIHPGRCGIIKNGWIDPATHAEVYCVGDAQSARLRPDGTTDPEASRSPRNLLVPGMPDRLRAAVPSSRSVSIGGKDRSAVLLGGRRPDVALWWDRGEGGFASSTYYAEALPPWVARWNARWVDAVAEPGDGGEIAWVWEPLFDELAGSGTAADDRPGELRFYPGGATFPHPAPVVSAAREPGELHALARFAYASPLVDQLALRLARIAVDEHELGADEHVDYLGLGLAACDTIGHAFGPYSREVTDVVLRVDRELGALFEHLDERVGAGRWIAALTADHGVLPLPEHLAATGRPGRRVPREAYGKALERIRARAAEAIGRDYTKAIDGGDWLLDREAIAAAGADLAEVRREVAAAALAATDLVARAYTWDELRAASELDQGAPHEDAFLWLAANDFHPERSADVVLQPRYGDLVSDSGTSHGTPYEYDRAVPLIFYGPGFEAGERWDEPVASADAVPTVLARLGLPVPDDLDGRVLP